MAYIHNLCNKYFYYGKCDDKKCKKRHMRYEVKAVPEKVTNVLPNELIMMIIQYCDMNAQSRFSRTAWIYYHLLKDYRKAIKQHKKIINKAEDDCQKMVLAKDPCYKVNTEYDNYDDFGRPFDGEWAVYRYVNCRYIELDISL